MKIERKPGSYVLLETASGTQQEFEINHAERILRAPENGGWKLPDNSPYQFDYYNGITKRTNHGASEKA
jgi:hypothetical protein